MSNLAHRIKNRIQRDTRDWVVRGNHLLRSDKDFKYFYVSHHKCATQYVQSIIRDVCDYRSIPCAKFDWRVPISGWDLQINKFLMIQDHSHEIIDWSDVQGRGFHVIRDPRDILVSLYFSHQKSHIVRDPKAQEILDNRRILNKVSKADGLHYIMDESEYFHRVMREIANWDYEREDFYETRFEKITAQPLEEFETIFSFLGVVISRQKLEQIISNNSFERKKKSAITADPKGEVNHYRKGKAGDWLNHFDETHKRVFKQKYGELLIRLDYATDLSW